MNISIADLRRISVGSMPPPRNPLIQSWKKYLAEIGRLKFVEPAIISEQGMMVFLLLAVIAQNACLIRSFYRIGENTTPIS